MLSSPSPGSGGRRWFGRRRSSARSGAAACRGPDRSRPSRDRMSPGSSGSRRARPCSTARVPRKSISPSARTVPPARSIASDVATARIVTPAHAASASRSMSPEQRLAPPPPDAGWSPASASARPVATEQEIPPPRVPVPGASRGRRPDPPDSGPSAALGEPAARRGPSRSSHPVGRAGPDPGGKRYGSARSDRSAGGILHAPERGAKRCDRAMCSRP